MRQSKAILMMDTNLVCPTSCKNLGPQILPKDIGGESGYVRLYVQLVARIWVLKSCHKAINDLFRVFLTLLPKYVPLPG